MPLLRHYLTFHLFQISLMKTSSASVNNPFWYLKPADISYKNGMPNESDVYYCLIKGGCKKYGKLLI